MGPLHRPMDHKRQKLKIQERITSCEGALSHLPQCPDDGRQNKGFLTITLPLRRHAKYHNSDSRTHASRNSEGFQEPIYFLPIGPVPEDYLSKCRRFVTKGPASRVMRQRQIGLIAFGGMEKISSSPFNDEVCRPMPSIPTRGPRGKRG